MSHAHKAYVPAAGHDWALPLYDPCVKLLGGQRAYRALIHQAALQPGHAALDVGCGTGNVSLLLKREFPGVSVTAIDPDPKSLARARRKAQRAGAAIQFDQGYADRLPYPDASFDRVFSSLMLHHLPAEDKPKMLREVRRVLKPGGQLHLLDFENRKGGPRSFLARLFHAQDHFSDNTESKIIALMRDAGLAEAAVVRRDHMLFLATAYFRALAPA